MISLLNDMAPILAFADEQCSPAIPGAEETGDGVSFSVKGDLTGATVEFPAPGESSGSVVPDGPGADAPHLSISSGSEAARDAVNASVPAGVDLRFEWMNLLVEEDPDYAVDALVPDGWSLSDGFNPQFDAPENFFSSIEFDTGCQGLCAPRDWSDVMDDAESSPFAVPADGELTVLARRELTEPDGRLLAFADDGVVRIVLTRWANDADRFFRCEVVLEGDALTDLWPTFAGACVAAEPRWF